MPIYDIALFTHRGAVRTANEDAVYAGGRIFQGNMRDVVTMQLKGAPQTVLAADGIGGQPHGDFASRAALQFLTSEAGPLDSPARCEAALHAANDHLYRLMSTPDRIGMGSTIVGATVQQSALITFNVGDSRAYLLSSHGLAILSHDDVPGSDERGGQSRSSHEITQALGGVETSLAILPHVSVCPLLAKGNRLLLCTDGLTDALADEEIEDILRMPEPSKTVVEGLVRKAIIAGSRDNISVLLVGNSH
jgi:protein phosphatase